MASAAEGQSFTAKTTEEKAKSSSDASMLQAGEDIIAKMLQQNRLRSERLQRYSTVRTYEVRNQQGKLAAQTVVHVDYEAPDKKTFNKTSEKG